MKCFFAKFSKNNNKINIILHKQNVKWIIILIGLAISWMVLWQQSPNYLQIN